MTKQELLSFLGRPVISITRCDAMASGCIGIVVAVSTKNLNSKNYVYCVDVIKSTTASLHDFDIRNCGDGIWETIKNPPHRFLDNCYYSFCQDDLTILTN